MIAIKGVRLEGFTFKRSDTEKESITGDYSLMSTVDKVLAKQGFNEYSGVKVPFSSDTMAMFVKLQVNIRKDIENVLGLTEGGEK